MTGAPAGLPPLPQRVAWQGAPGLFGKGKHLEQLEHENRQLWAWAQAALGVDAAAMLEQSDQLQARLADLTTQVHHTQQQLDDMRKLVADTSEAALLQEVGVYEYSHPLDDALAYKAELAVIKDRYKAMIKNGQAVAGSMAWQVNNSLAEGRKMVKDFSKLMLRAYNAEADSLVRNMKPYKLTAAKVRLTKTGNTIARLGKTMQIYVTDEYHQVRLAELELTADYLAKSAEEKERLREERARLREEEKAQRDFEREKARLLKEQSHYGAVLAKYEAKGDTEAVEELRAKLSEIDDAIGAVESREANIRTGYVYVISNFGAFGEHMVKVGLTRRLDPMDRVRELGDASVPFRFDVHALIFSDDAVGLENRLHKELADRRVNRVNLRREFFNATPAEVRQILESLETTHLLEYHETPEAEEWRASQRMSSDEESPDVVVKAR